MRFYTPVHGLLLMISLINSMLMFNEMYSWLLKLSVNMFVDFYMMVFWLFCVIIVTPRLHCRHQFFDDKKTRPCLQRNAGMPTTVKIQNLFIKIS